MKVPRGGQVRLRRVLARGVPFLGKAWSLLRARWRDLLFTLLVTAGLILYLVRLTSYEKTEDLVPVLVDAASCRPLDAAWTARVAGASRDDRNAFFDAQGNHIIYIL